MGALGTARTIERGTGPMKEIEVLAGAEIFKEFQKAWDKFTSGNYEQVVTFHHNGVQVFLAPDNAKYMRRDEKGKWK